MIKGNPNFSNLYSATKFAFSGSLGVFNFDDLERGIGDDDYDYISYTVYGFLLLVNMVILMNLLVAMLNNIYIELSKKGKPLHLREIVGLKYIYDWDDRYGCVMMLPFPLDIIFFPLYMIVLSSSNPKKLNDIIARFIFKPY